MARVAMLFLAFCISMTPLLGGVASAQKRTPGERDPQGRVFTKIKVTVAGLGEYERPVSGVSFFVVTEGGRPASVSTDDAGVATAWLAPTTYRLVTRTPVVFNDKSYTWDLLISVKPGMGAINLTTANATAVVASSPPVDKALGDRGPHKPSETPRSATRTGATSERRAFWINAGLGFGSLGCGICDGYLGGLTGGVSMGGNLSPRILAGLGATGWTKSASGESLSGGTFDARIKVYPSLTRGLFVTGGAGVGMINSGLSDSGTTTETGFGGVVGIGMDFPVANGLSLTPFWNGFGVKTSKSNVRVSQVGIGITVR